jgi:hypothetical protein
MALCFGIYSSDKKSLDSKINTYKYNKMKQFSATGIRFAAWKALHSTNSPATHE